MIPSLRRCCALLVLALCAQAHAQTAQKVYVTRDFKAGLHEEKSVDSPITKLVSSGAALEVIKREDPLSFVRTADGATGWIDNSYLVNELPTDTEELKRMRERSDALERRLNEANQRIAELESSSPAPAGAEGGAGSALAKRNQELEQQLKSERLRAGELQVQITELRKRLDLAGDESSLFERVEQLEAENRKLRLALPGGAPPPEGASARPLDPKRAWGYALLLLAIGIGGGMYLMDWLNRRRHGGFRI